MSSPAVIPAAGPAEPALPCPSHSETPRFDRLAGAYRWMEWFSFGPYLSRCRRAFLPDLQDARHALVLGDGDGRFTAALLHQNRGIRIDAVDASPAMLQALGHGAGADAERLRTKVRDLREWKPEQGRRYDLVVTHFFLDCLTTAEVLALAGRIAPELEPEARWVVSEFDVPNGAFGRWIARPIVALLYRAFGVLTGLRIRALPEFGAALQEAGFTLEKQRTWLAGLLLSQTWRYAGGE